MHDRNEGPEFSLVAEPWIPVTPRGQPVPVMVGLADALTNASSYSGLAEGNPLVRASLLRFLTSMTYLVLDEQFGGDVAAARKAGPSVWSDGFDSEAVAAVCDRWDDRLWLFHPDTPFFQDPLMATDTSLKAPLGPLAITPHLPGESGPRWGVNMADAESISLDEAARLVVTNWFYTPVGNSSRRSGPPGPDGKPLTSKRVASAAGANFPNLTNFFRVGNSLHETLLSNVLSAYLPGGDPAAVPAFLKVRELSVRYETFAPLYAATLSAACCLIVDSAPSDDRLSTNFLRGSTLFDGECGTMVEGKFADTAKRFTSLSLSEDPHVLYMQNKKNSDNHPRLNVSGSLLSLPRFCLATSQLVNKGELYKCGIADKKGLLLREASSVDIEILQIQHGGTVTARTIAGSELVRVAPQTLAPSFVMDDGKLLQERSEQIADVLEPLLGSAKSVLSHLWFAVRSAVDENSQALPSEFRTKVINDFLSRVAITSSRLIEEITAKGVEQVDLKLFREEWQGEAMEVFERHTEALRYSQTSADRYWQAKSRLSGTLRKVLVDG